MNTAELRDAVHPIPKARVASARGLDTGMEHPLHPKFTSAVMDTLKPSWGDTLRNLDDQITETRHLCERINAAIRRESDAPYFPERRNHYEPHEPNRRWHQVFF
jgi:hypothetical protein